MTLARSALFAAACGLTAIHASPAHAQSAGAEALFRDGRALIKAGKLEAGCDKLAASEKIESSVGTLLNLGDCREQLGQTATAWAAFRKAESMAKRAGDDYKRQAEARRRAEKLEPLLSSLVIQIGPNAKTTSGLVIKRDGEVLDDAILNSPVPVDPGAHTIVVEAPGHKPFTTEVSIGKGGKRFVVIPTLEALPAPAPVVVSSTPAAPAAPAARTTFESNDTEVAPLTPAPAPVIERSTWSGTRKASVAVGLLGAAAIGGGVYFGTRANTLETRANEICPDTVCADPTALSLNDDAQDKARNANILLLAGGAALATATVMWFVGGPEERTVVAPSIGNGGAGAVLVRRF